jgi:hypothetical protein
MKPGPRTKPPVHSQGKIVVQPGDEGLLVMMPDGDIRAAADVAEANRLARAWIKKHMRADAINVTTVEWIGCTPPSS